MDEWQLSELSVVIPNLHWRYSGVTATNRMVAPRLGERAGWLGPDAPLGVARLSLGDLWRLRLGAQRHRPRIWHAWRHNEMLVGRLFQLLGWPMPLILP